MPPARMNSGQHLVKRSPGEVWLSPDSYGQTLSPCLRNHIVYVRPCRLGTSGGRRRPASRGGLTAGDPLCNALTMMIDKDGAADSPIVFRLDPNSGVPTYQQIVRQVEQALRLGYLVPGDRLPTVKDVVATLAINPNTVLKAYRELEHKGLAGGRPGQGTFVEGTLEVVPLSDQQALHRGLARWLDAALEAGLDADGITALFANALHDRMNGGAKGGTRGNPHADRRRSSAS